MPTKVTTVAATKCKPFQLQVMVFSPDAGFKFELIVEQACSPTAEPVWKLVFDLYKKKAQGDDFDQIIHVSFTATTPAETQGIQTMIKNGLTEKAADAVFDKAYPAAKALDGVQNPSPAQKQAVHEAMSNVATLNLTV